MYKLVIFCFRVFFKLFYRVKVEYTCPLKDIPRGVIIAPNHASYLDPPIVAASWRRSLRFFAGSHLFKKPFLGFLLPRLQCYPVVRGKERTTIRQAIELLKGGHDIVVFPEGTRSKDGKLQTLKTGVSYISLMTGCPIIPCYIQGTYEAWPRGTKFPKLFRRSLIICRFGKPVITDSKAQNKEQVTAALEKNLCELAHD